MIISEVFPTLLIIIAPVMVIAQPIEDNVQLGLRSAIDENQIFPRWSRSYLQSRGAGPSGASGDPKAGDRVRVLPPKPGEGL